MATKKAEFDSIIEKLPYKGGMHLMVVPNRVAQKFTERKAVRVFCTINQVVRYPCAIRPDGEGGFFINVATTILRKGKLSLGQKIHVLVELDKTEYGHKVPEELKEILNTDDLARKYFEYLSNSQQRSLIYYIAQAKSIDKRIERSLVFINRLKNTNGTWRPGKG